MQLRLACSIRQREQLVGVLRRELLELLEDLVSELRPVDLDAELPPLVAAMRPGLPELGERHLTRLTGTGTWFPGTITGSKRRGPRSPMARNAAPLLTATLVGPSGT